MDLRIDVRTGTQLRRHLAPVYSAVYTWAKENMLNPIYRDYLVARADVILNVTRAIRGGVPSDISQKMEEGAFPVPLDPKSVYEWYKTQSKLMAPYMKGYGLTPPKLKSFEEMSGKGKPESNSELTDIEAELKKRGVSF